MARAKRAATTARTAKPAAGKTPVAEWIAAGLGLVLTLSVLGYSIWESVAQDGGPPVLSVTAEAPVATAVGFVVPIEVRNAGEATAAAVEVRGELQAPDGRSETAHATLAYVPAGGEARAGVVFRNDPRSGRLSLAVEGYEEP